ncbi:MAG: PIN domain-containing protein [Gammaproteobacteria bacterium]|nr:MAG: PIN domain-containing protein [Gammaproteobacteria bacterium]
MILYLDTSALVKAYFTEAFTPIILSKIEEADTVSSHVITFVETHATFARLQREGKINETQLITLKREFIADWENYLQISMLPALILRAAEFAEAFALRAYDSVHLAAVEHLQKSTKQSVEFACFDHRLNQAAKILGISLITNEH